DGEFVNGAASSVSVFFYVNAPGNLPGAAVASQTGIAYTGSAGDLSIPLTSPVVLAPGTYWLSVQAKQDFSTSGQWFWHGRTVQSNQGAVWENPGNGFNDDCPTWTRIPSCSKLNVSNPDLVFRLNGVAGTAPNTKITKAKASQAKRQASFK